MSDLKNSIKENSLKIDLGVFENGEFDPSCVFCTVSCTWSCSAGCSSSDAPGAITPDQQV